MSINWRTSGDTSFDAFSASLPSNSQITLRNETRAVYDAVRPYSRLFRGMLEAESSGATNYNAVPASFNNPVNMRIRGQEPFQQFASIAEGAAEWKDRLTSPSYAYRDTQTVADLVSIYAPSNDNNNEAQYVATVERVIASLPIAPQGAPPVPEKPLTFGKVPHPAYHDRPISKKEGVGMNNLGKRTVKGVSWHRILGSLWGTDSFFRSPTVAALTDYGVGVTDEDGASHDGEILRWNDPLGYQSGWASGTYSSFAYGDGAAFVNKYGVNAINRDRASIEISGFQNTPLSPGAKQAIAAITAYWADQAQVPWHTFPNVPQDGFSFVCWHEEFGPDQGQKKCPFDAVKDATPELIQMTADILKQYQEQPVVIPPQPKPEKYAAPITYPWLSSDDGLVHEVGSTRVLPLTLTYTALRSTPRYQRGSKTGDKIGPNIAKGTTFKAGRVFRSSEGITWVMTPHGSRVVASALLPRVGVTASGRISIRHDSVAAPEVISEHVEGTP